MNMTPPATPLPRKIGMESGSVRELGLDRPLWETVMKVIVLPLELKSSTPQRKLLLTEFPDIVTPETPLRRMPLAAPSMLAAWIASIPWPFMFVRSIPSFDCVPCTVMWVRIKNFVTPLIDIPGPEDVAMIVQGPMTYGSDDVPVPPDTQEHPVDAPTDVKSPFEFIVMGAWFPPVRLKAKTGEVPLATRSKTRVRAAKRGLVLPGKPFVRL